VSEKKKEKERAKNDEKEEKRRARNQGEEESTSHPPRNKPMKGMHQFRILANQKSLSTSLLLFPYLGL
jgi:hypothetical protein